MEPKSEFIDLEHIKELIRREQFIISGHARSRMFQRNVDTDELMEVMIESQIIETYPEDAPCPSALLLGFLRDEAYHVVVAQCADHIRMVTMYSPAKDKWIDNRIRTDKQ